MIFKKPVSFILFIVAICLTLCSFFIPVFIMPVAALLSVTGFVAGIVYDYTKKQSKLLNRIGWIGNLLFLIGTLALFCYMVMQQE